MDKDDDKKEPKDKDPIDDNRSDVGKNTGNKSNGGTTKNIGYAKGDSGDGKQLPSTATTTYNYLAIGAVLIIIGFVAIYVQHRRKRKSML